jgi:tetraacyldisaccharide 4'-kinase
VDEARRRQLTDTIARVAPGVPIAQTRHQPVKLVNAEGASTSVERLRQGPVAAFCGIGNPEAFRRTLIDLGTAVTAFRAFPDHHGFSRTDVEDLRSWARRHAPECVVVTTQKDLVKLRLTHLDEHELWALRIHLHFDTGQEALDHKLQAVVRGP